MKDKSKLIMSISAALLTLIVGIVANLLSSKFIDWIKFSGDYLQIVTAAIGIIVTIITLITTLQAETKRSKKETNDKNPDGEQKNG